MDINLYAVAMVAHKRTIGGNQNGLLVSIIPAISEAEARTRALNTAKDKFPPDFGWHDHQVSVSVMSQDQIQWIKKHK